LELQSSSEDDSGSDNETRTREESKMSWKQFLRKKLLNRDSKALEENPWLKELGYDIRDHAVKDVLTALKINMAKDLSSVFNLGFHLGSETSRNRFTFEHAGLNNARIRWC